MNKVAEFQKVSYEQYEKDSIKTLGSIYTYNTGRKPYENIVLPTRSTSGSAGYDIRSTVEFELKPGETITIPTGLRCKIDEGWFFMIVPRSGLGFKYRLQLDNSVGIIDSDYYNAENEGHIMAKITNDSKNGDILHIKEGDRFAQGIFVPYGITYSDESSGTRTGGFGSSGIS